METETVTGSVAVVGERNVVLGFGSVHRFFGRQQVAAGGELQDCLAPELGALSG